MTTTPKKARTKAAKSTPMPIALAHTSVAEAVAELRALDTRRHLIPAAGRAQLLAMADEIQAAADAIGLESAAQLVTQQTHLLKALTGVDQPLQFHKSATAERLHSYRNLMLTLATAATGAFHGDPTGLYERMVKLTPRTHALRRPCTDDEILLLRTVIYLDGRARPRSLRPAVYTLVEAGMTPGETTHVSLNDHDDHEMPQMVLAAGNAHLQPRFLPLDGFNTVVLGRFTEAAHRAGHAATKPLTYEGRKHDPGTSQATASAQGVLDRLLKEIGLFNADTSATSIRLWRLATTHATQDVKAAQELGGYGGKKEDQERLWRTLGFLQKPQAPDDSDDEDESFL
ncbi:MAG: hypothetical protein ACXWLF_08225 [Myxococcaceae bacterium]